MAVRLPLLGILLFFLIGSPKLPQRRREKQQDMDRLIEEAARAVGPVRPGEDAPAWFRRVGALVDRVGAMPLLLQDTTPAWSWLRRAAAHARLGDRRGERYVHSEFYITIRDSTTEPFFEALRRAVVGA